MFPKNYLCLDTLPKYVVLDCIPCELCNLGGRYISRKKLDFFGDYKLKYFVIFFTDIEVD